MLDIRDIGLEITGHMLNFTDAELEMRHERMREALREEGLGVMLILDRCREGYTAYLTGRPMPDVPFNRAGGFIVPAEGKMIDMKSDVLITEEYLQNYHKLDETVTEPAKNPMFEEALGCYYRDIAPHILPGKTARVGVVHLSAMTAAMHDYLHQHIENLELIDLSEKMARLKSVRTEEEILYARISANSAERVLSAMPFMLRPGRLEHELVTDIRKRVYDLGAGGQDTARMANITLTSAPDGGASAQEPLPYPGRRIQNGDRVNLCLRAISYNDIYSGVGRCYVLGTPSEEARRFWALAVGAQDAAAQALRPGVTLNEVKARVEDYAAQNGVTLAQTNFLYGLCYVIGEYPMLYTRSADAPLEEGMIVCVAPAIQPEGKDAYCCQDPYLITANGCERLTRMPRDLVAVRCD